MSEIYSHAADAKQQQIQNVVHSYTVRMAALEVAAAFDAASQQRHQHRHLTVRTAQRGKVLREITDPRVLEAFGSGIRFTSSRSAASHYATRKAGIADSLKKLVEVFNRAPKKWGEFKKMIGSKSLLDLPGKIKGMFKSADSWLRKAGQKLVESLPPLQIYLSIGNKLPSVGDWMKEAVKKLPEPIQKALNAVGTSARNLAQWIDEMASRNRVIKPAAKVISAGVFAYVWFNVVEISWDIPEIIRGFLGGYSFTELLGSLPESALGLLIGMLFPGIPGGLVWNAILPITIALRIAWLLHKGLVRRVGGHKFEVV